MTPEFAYFLKVNVAFILLYAFYRLFFYKDTFFKLRRTILLAFFGVSLLYPLMNIQDWIREQGPIVEVIQMYSAILPETTITPGNVPQTNWHDLLLPGISYLYWSGVIALSFRFLVQLSSILLLARRSEVTLIRNVRVHLLNKPAGPFSFFRLVFLHPDSHSEKEIDEINILQATYLAMRRAYDNMQKACDYVLIDGNRMPPMPVPGETIVKGDANSPSIAAASILAKVSRDRVMLEYAKQYPGYHFEKHKGYGTKVHVEALHEFGPCPIHRKTFLKKILG